MDDRNQRSLHAQFPVNTDSRSRLFYEVHVDIMQKKTFMFGFFLSKYLCIVSLQALGEKNPQEPKVSLDPKKTRVIISIIFMFNAPIFSHMK